MYKNKLIFSHRGLHNKNYPENSIPAFENSIKCGFDIEFDVQLTKDNKLVVFHDKNINRMTGIDKKVSDCTLDELRDINLLDTCYTIPTLEETLKTIKGEVTIYIEIKSKNNTRKICSKLLELLNRYNGKVYIASFNPFDLIWFKRHAKRYDRIQLAMKEATKGRFITNCILKNTLFNFITKPTYVSYKLGELNNKLETKYAKNNVGILQWTIKNNKEFNKSLKKYNGVIFEGFIPNKD